MNTTIQLPLSETLSTFVDEQAARQGYNGAADYIAALLEAEQKKKAQEQLDALLLEGLNSGPAKPLTDANWEQLRQRVKARASGGGLDE
jgi:antitoxin ParD1/3/4